MGRIVIQLIKSGREHTVGGGSQKHMGQQGRQENGREEKLGEEMVMEINYNIYDNTIWNPASL